MSNLPNDILFQIFDLVDEPTIIYNTCSKWREALTSRYRVFRSKQDVIDAATEGDFSSLVHLYETTDTV